MFNLRTPSFVRRLGGLVLACVLTAPAAAQAGPVERALLDEAPGILQWLREHNYHHVGILKFRVKKGSQDPSANAGPLNVNFARRLETALLLRYDEQRDRDLVLLHDASTVAASIRRADHLTPEGRGLLFQGEYRPLWGKTKPVRADAFLVGRADLSDDLRTVTVNLCAFGKDLKVEKVAVFQAHTDLNTLAEAGESFNLRAFVRDDGSVQTGDMNAAAADKAQEAKEGKEDNGLLANLPVQLEVHYVDRQTGQDQAVPLKVQGGRATVPEPTENQQVYFVLRRNDPSQARYGVALLVNGVNTVFEERLPPERCTKWIIEPGSAPLTIRGFQQPAGGMQPFVVRSPEESERNAVNYGADVGTFTFVLFREGAKDAKRPKTNLDELAAKREEAAVVDPPEPPADLPQDAGPVKEEATKSAEKLLGLVEKSGFVIDSSVTHVDFVNAVPLETVTIRYYTPRGR